MKRYMKALNRAFDKAFSHNGDEDTIDELLMCMGEELGCDRISIFEKNEEGTCDNTYGLCQVLVHLKYPAWIGSRAGMLSYMDDVDLLKLHDSLICCHEMHSFRDGLSEKDPVKWVPVFLAAVSPYKVICRSDVVLLQWCIDESCRMTHFNKIIGCELKIVMAALCFHVHFKNGSCAVIQVVAGVEDQVPCFPGKAPVIGEGPYHDMRVHEDVH